MKKVVLFVLFFLSVISYAGDMEFCLVDNDNGRVNSCYSDLNWCEGNRTRRTDGTYVDTCVARPKAK
jgi:hypothetical protein